MLTAHTLSVGVAGKRLLTGVELSVDAGEIMAVTGPSGCGKTTLFRSLVGLIDPLEGVVKLEGRTGAEVGWTAFRRRVMLVAQRPMLFDGTVADNLQRPFSYASAAGETLDLDEAETLLSSVGVPGVLEQEARTLSEGQAQRVCLVRGLLAKPAVLLLDEPTSALDPESALAVETLLRERGPAVLIISHDRDQVTRLADAVLELEPFFGGG